MKRRPTTLSGPSYLQVVELACAKRVSPSAQDSDAHGHEDVAVLYVLGAVFGAHLAGGLGVLELQAGS
jgi:hypothetical protein